MARTAGPRRRTPSDTRGSWRRPGRDAPLRGWGVRLLDVALLGGILWLLTRPGSGPRGFLEEIRTDRHESRVLEAAWPALLRGPALGSPADDAATVVMFTDYRCPFCRQAQDVVDAVLESRPDVRVVVRHLPLRSLHPDAPLLALVSICAEDDPAWPEVHRALPEWPQREEEGKDAAGRAILVGAGLEDPAEVLHCVDSEAARRRLREDTELAARLGLRATPTFVGAGSLEAGALSPERLTEMLGGR